MTIATEWPTVRRAPTVPSAAHFRAYFLAALHGADPGLAEELAGWCAARAVAIHPGATVWSDRGVVTCDPDRRFPDRPFVRDDEVRFSLRGLGGVEPLDGEKAEGGPSEDMFPPGEDSIEVPF